MGRQAELPHVRTWSGARRRGKRCCADSRQLAALRRVEGLLEGQASALEELPLQLRQLREELETLADCLCAVGVLTPTELAVRREQRFGAAGIRELLVRPASARRIAEAMGLGPVGRLSAASSAMSATYKEILFPAGDLPALPEERWIAAREALGIGVAAGAPAEDQPAQPRSVFTLKFFAWPFGGSQPPASLAGRSSGEPAAPADHSVRAEGDAEDPPGGAAAEPGSGEPGASELEPKEPQVGEPGVGNERSEADDLEAGAPGVDGPRDNAGGRLRIETAKPETESCETETPKAERGSEATDDATPRDATSGGQPCSEDPQPDTRTSRFFGRLFMGREDPPAMDAGAEFEEALHPAKARQLETLADATTEVTECTASLVLEQLPDEGGRRAAAEVAGPKPPGEAPQEAPPKEGVASPQRGTTARFFGRILGYGASADADEDLGVALLSIHQIARIVGRSAGMMAACQLSQTSRALSEPLSLFLEELREDAPQVYVCGGSCGIAVDSAERFCPRTGLWESLPPMCIPRRACTAASVGGRFYVMGGVDVPRFSAGAYSDSMQQPWVFENKYRPECFDPITMTWELLPPMNRPYTHASAVACAGLLYVFGGLSFGSVLDQAQRFDPSKHLWEGLEPMPTPRFECAAAAARGLLFVLGGANPCGEPLATAECYSPTTGHWHMLPRMGDARYGCAAASINGKVYVFGGHGIWENLAGVEVFDPEADRWGQLRPMSVRRNHCGAAVASGKIYVFGGHTNGQDIITIECLDPQTGSWEVAALMARPRSHCMTATVQP